MATHDYIIANGSGSSVRSDLNLALSAIVTNNSNGTEPATTYGYQWWADTTANELKLRNGANNGWISFAKLDGNRLLQDGSVSAPSLAFADDLNTGFYSPANDQLAIATGGVQRLKFVQSEAVFNEGGNDYDFRVEGDANANLFFVNAGTDRVGIGTNSPSKSFDVRGTSQFRNNSSDIILIHDDTEEIANIGTSSGRLIINAKGSQDELRIQANGNEKIRIKATGAVRLNGSTDATNFKITTTGLIESLPTYNNTTTTTTQTLRITDSGRIQRITSSRRYKDNIVSAENVGGLSVVVQLEPRQWADHVSGEQVFGLVAEEVYEAGATLAVDWAPYNPNAAQNDSTPVTRNGSVAAEGDEVIDAVNNRGLIMHLIEAVKDLKAENDALRARIEALEASPS